MKQLCERYNRAVANIKKLVRLMMEYWVEGRGEMGRGCGEGNESEGRWEERGRGRGRGKREGLTHTVCNGVFSGHGLSRLILGGSGPTP